jgi:hypothetical protein
LLFCYFMAPSLTRGRVFYLLLLLGLVSAVPVGSESGGIQDHILLSQFFRLPHPGGPGPRIYIPQEQGGQVIPPGTGFPLRRLLRLAVPRWRYSNPPPHGLRFSRRSHITTDGQSVSQYVKVSSPLWDLWPNITFCPNVVFWKLLSCLCGAPSLTKGRGCHLSSVCNNLPEFTSSIYVTCVRVRVCVTLRLTVSQCVLVLSPLCGRLTRYCFLIKNLGLEFVVISLWDALSDERPGLSFLSHSLCLHIYVFVFHI